MATGIGNATSFTVPNNFQSGNTGNGPGQLNSTEQLAEEEQTQQAQGAQAQPQTQQTSETTQARSTTESADDGGASLLAQTDSLTVSTDDNSGRGGNVDILV